MQISSFAVNTAVGLSADTQRFAVQAAYTRTGGTNPQPGVLGQAGVERKKNEQITAPENESAKDAVKPPTQEEVNRALQQLNGAFSKPGQTLMAIMERDKDTGIDVFKITDKLTKEVILQLPPKAIVEMAKAMQQGASDKVQLISEKA